VADALAALAERLGEALLGGVEDERRWFAEAQATLERIGYASREAEVFASALFVTGVHAVAGYGRAQGVAPVFVCPDCGRGSRNPHDVEHGYCGACHRVTARAN
jgi:hypothetical protein